MSRSKKAVALILVAILALGAASAALGAFRKGIYRTKAPVNHNTFLDFGFTATKTKASAVRYTYRRNRGCSNGRSLVGNEGDYVIPAAPINARGRFSISVTEPDGDTLRITGRMRRHGATGTFRSSFKIGPVICNSRRFHWKAYHLG